MTEILLLSTVEKIWNCLGFNLKRSTGFINNIYISFAFLVIFTVTVLGFLIMFSEDFDLNALADVFESCGPNYQLLSKIVINGLSVGTIRSLLSSMEEKFWNVNKFGQNVNDRLLRYFNVIKFAYKIYCYIMCCCGIIICMRPIFLEKRRYPLASYNIVDVSYTPYFLMIYSFHIFDFVYGVSMFLAVDGLFAVFVLNILCQVTMLKYGFESLNMNYIKNDRDEDECYRKIKEYVDHHNFILEFLENLNKLYSIQLFNQFLGNTASVCMGIYITSAPSAEISSQIRSCFILATFITEMGIYCIGGTLLTEACLQLADSMYMSNWEWTTRKKLRFAVQMVIMRSLKAQRIRAGGLFDIKVVTLVSILQSSFSFYTLMNNVESNTELEK